ncbi:hypothetical protein [Autumnicola edwardsiae]|uniref:Co-chaperone DjlA N-terminal domain-containing protein n=1 Tax=Autumnicola edwardsiae TaxID=3075594 RepID=A0ABU3D036_9FLAO|nr:hypothetical protein [Zunongwangia sp. F297]MDT0651853.1 hypothetical protein [Zunongwangia sp. F297]
MEQSKDFIEREIQKLTLLITMLIGKVNGNEPEDFDETLKEVNEELEEQFGFQLEELEEMDNQKLLMKLNSGNELTIDAFTKLLHQIIFTKDQIRRETTLNVEKLADKALFLLNYMDKTSSTFSMERMKMKEDLQNQK